MPDRDHYHGRMVRFFSGEFGSDVYQNATMTGQSRPGKVVLDSYVGLYPDGVRFFQLTPGRLNKRLIVNDALGYTLSEDLGGQVVQLNLSTDPAAIDSALWLLARARTQRLDLPTCFVTRMHYQQGGDRKDVFWFPRMVPGKWMLQKFQEVLRGEL